MQILENHQVMQMLAKILHKPMMEIYIPDNDDPKLFWEILQAAPYLTQDHFQIISDGHAYLLFDDDVEMQHYYQLTVGDDGPTELNSYHGTVRVYALTCNIEGELENENT